MALFRSKTKAEPEVAAPAAVSGGKSNGGGLDGATPPPAAAVLPEAAAAGSADVAKQPAGDGAAGTEEAQRRAVAAIRQSLAFTQIVTVLMRSPRHRHYALSDLEWLVIPPLVAGQCSVAEAKSKQSGVSVPVAVALWASVSPEVDKKLSENLHMPIRLRPDEWRSGDILWLVDAVGDPRVVPQLVKQLVETTFKGREAKMRAAGESGKVVVQRISAKV